MKQINYEQLFDLVIKDIPIKSEENVYGITFFASPGAGKSTVAKMLSDKMGLYVTANDKIRRIVEKFGVDVEENRKMIEQLANDRTIYMLENKTSMIIDANMHFFWKNALENFKNHGAQLYFVRLECEENINLERIENRALRFDENPENFSRAKGVDYFKYKEKAKDNPIPEDQIFYTIKNNGSLDDLEKQVDKLIEKLNNIRMGC